MYEHPDLLYQCAKMHHQELLEQAAQKRLIKSIQNNHPGDQSFVARAIERARAWLPVNEHLRERPHKQHRVSGSCCT